MEGLISPERAYELARATLAKRVDRTDTERMYGHPRNACAGIPEFAIYPDFFEAAHAEAVRLYADGAGHMDTAITSGIARAVSMFSTQEG